MLWRMLMAGLLSGVAAGATACPNPVFQYAFQHWDADPYVAVARGVESWPEEQRAALRLLESGGAGGVANLQVRREPAATNAAASAAPRLEVVFPDANGVSRRIWSGTPSVEGARRLLDSPARAEISRLLLRGKAAVWVVLECGDRRKNGDAARTLQDELRRIERTLTISDADSSGGFGGPGAGGPPAVSQLVSFGLVRVRRDDPAEAMLVPMLLNSKPDLERKSGEPLLFPVYGRGLILDGFSGQDFDPRRIWGVAEFLTGPCSCVFKEGWHGASLLLSADWYRAPEPAEETPPAAAGGAPVSAGGFLRRIEQGATNTPGPAPAPEKGKDTP